MKIGIIGKGFVGSAVYEGLGWVGNEMSFYDPKYPESKIEDVLDTECVFICVPTNPKEDGTCNTDIVDTSIIALLHNGYKGVIAIKSTVTPGTTDKIRNTYSLGSDPFPRIVFVPEFLRERSALTDFLDNHDILIVGAYDNKDADVIIQAHRSLPKNVRVMKPLEAELAKYFNNVYNTLRVVFANGFYEVCKHVGADYQKIFDAMIKRENITHHYLRCSESLRGASGPCLPKESIAFMKYVDSLGLSIKPEIFRTIVMDNLKYPKTVIEGTRTEKEFFGKELTMDSIK